MTNIKKAIQQMAGKALMQTYLCKVVSVNNHTCECEPVTGGANFLDVRLRSVVDNGTGGLILKPKVDSIVIIGLLENNEATAFVIGYSDIELLYFKSDGGMTFEVKEDVVKINGDDFNGLVKLKELKDNLDALKQFVEAMNNALPTAFNAILPTAPAPFVASGALGATTYQTSMASKQIIFKDMENTKVKHG